MRKYTNSLDFPLDDEDINQILVYLELGQIGKLQFEYGQKVLSICLEWAELKEDYELCSEIKKLCQASPNRKY